VYELAKQQQWRLTEKDEFRDHWSSGTFWYLWLASTDALLVAAGLPKREFVSPEVISAARDLYMKLDRAMLKQAKQVLT
jgi:hypothetical protein